MKRCLNCQTISRLPFFHRVKFNQRMQLRTNLPVEMWELDNLVFYLGEEVDHNSKSLIRCIKDRRNTPLLHLLSPNSFQFSLQIWINKTMVVNMPRFIELEFKQFHNCRLNIKQWYKRLSLCKESTSIDILSNLF